MTIIYTRNRKQYFWRY